MTIEQLHYQQQHHHHQTVAERPFARQAMKFTTAATVGLTCLALSGLTMTGTVLALVVITPLLVLFSPVLVPALLALLLAGGGVLFSGACGAVAVGIVTWIYSYVKGNHPIGAAALDHATRVVEDTASELKEKVLEAKDRVTEEAREVVETGDRTVEVKEKEKEKEKEKKGKKGQHKGQQES